MRKSCLLLKLDGLGFRKKPPSCPDRADARDPLPGSRSCPHFFWLGVFWGAQALSRNASLLPQERSILMGIPRAAVHRGNVMPCRDCPLLRTREKAACLLPVPFAQQRSHLPRGFCCSENCIAALWLSVCPGPLGMAFTQGEGIQQLY